MPASQQVQAQTLEKFIEGWRTISAESWTALWSDKCTQRFLPLAMGIPPSSKPEIMAQLPQLLSVLSNWELVIRNTVHDVEHSKAAIYALSKADTAFDENFKWTNEYAIFVQLNENGTSIDCIEEMVDTAFYQQFHPRFMKYLAGQGSAK